MKSNQTDRGRSRTSNPTLRSKDLVPMSSGIGALAFAGLGFAAGFLLASAEKKAPEDAEQNQRELKRKQGNLLKHMAFFLKLGPGVTYEDTQVTMATHRTFASLVDEMRKLSSDGKVVELQMDARDADLHPYIQQIYRLFAGHAADFPLLSLDPGMHWVRKLMAQQFHGSEKWLFLHEIASGSISIEVLERIGKGIDPKYHQEKP